MLSVAKTQTARISLSTLGKSVIMSQPCKPANPMHRMDQFAGRTDKGRAYWLEPNRSL